MNCSACQYGVSSSELELNTRSAPRHTHCYPASARLRTCLPSRASSVTQPETAGDIAPASISYEDEDAKRDVLDSLLGQVLQRPDALSAVSTLHGRSRKAIKLFVVITPDVYKGFEAGPGFHCKPGHNIDVSAPSADDVAIQAEPENEDSLPGLLPLPLLPNIAYPLVMNVAALRATAPAPATTGRETPTPLPRRDRRSNRTHALHSPQPALPPNWVAPLPRTSSFSARCARARLSPTQGTVYGRAPAGAVGSARCLAGPVPALVSGPGLGPDLEGVLGESESASLKVCA